METGAAGKNRKLTLVKGGLYGTPRGGRKKKGAAMAMTAAEFRLDQQMHSAFCALNAPDGTVPSEGVQLIREHRQWPWRVLGRRLREAVNAGVTSGQLYEITHELNLYIAYLLREREGTEKRRA